MNDSHTTVYQRVSDELNLRRMPRGFSWKRMFLWLGSVVMFSIIAFGACAFALGYTVDADERQLQQTGRIEIDGTLSGLPLELYVNDKLVSTKLPFQISRVEPDEYRIRIERQGYKTWTHSAQLLPNRRLRIAPVVMLYSNPTILPASTVTAADARFSQRDASGLEIKSGNELWTKDGLIMRTSPDLNWPQWLAQRSIIAVQAGNEILFAYPTLKTTQVIYTLPNQKPAQFFFEENGRVLYVLQEDGVVNRVELYEPVNFFSFFQ